jgi:hypothetical protein
VPNLTEAEAASALRDAISPDCPSFNNMVISNVVPDILYLNDQPLGESNRSTVRLALKLELLATKLRADMTSMGHPTSLPVLVVESAYRYPPADPADVSLQNEGRAAIISLPSPIPSVFGNASKLMQYAVAAHFDYIYFESDTQIYVAVVPDSCSGAFVCIRFGPSLLLPYFLGWVWPSPWLGHS